MNATSLVLLGCLLVGDDPEPEGIDARLRTRDGEELSGRVLPAADGRLGWKSDDFREPLSILPGTLEWLRVDGSDESDGALATTHDLLSFELLSGGPHLPRSTTGPDRRRAGDHLRGRLLAVGPESWSIEAEGVGTIEVPARLLTKVERLGGSRIVFNGPAGLAGWTQTGSQKEPWRAEPGVLVGEGTKAVLERDLGLLEDCELTLELGWAGEPAFRVALGVPGNDKLSAGVILEAWGDLLVVRRELEERLELVTLPGELAPDGHVVVRARFEPEHVVFLDTEGAEVGRIGRGELTGPCLAIGNDGTRTEVRSLYVLEGPGEEPPVRIDGDDVVGYDADTLAFDLGSETVPLDRIAGMDFDGGNAAPALGTGDVWLSYLDGRRFGGVFVRWADDAVVIQSPWSTATFECPVAGLARIDVVDADSGPARRKPKRSFLQTASGEVAGTLEGIGPEGEIVWNPTISEGSATLDRGAVKRVVLNRTTAYYVSSRKFPHLLRLRSGDSYRCKMLSIAGDEIRYESSFGGERTVSTDLVKAVELDVRALKKFRKLLDEPEQPQQSWGWGRGQPVRRETSAGFDAASLERALALPRKYKRRPMENLFLAPTGDFLRTNLESWSPEGALYPGLSDDSRLIPNDRLAAIVWLDESPEREAGDRVRVVLDDETRLTMNLSGTREGHLEGTSERLGDLSIELRKILSIELDPAAVTEPCPYEEWTLRPMKEPFPDADADAPATVGPRVGERAPEIEGADMEGNAFALSDYEGKVVLLEFWAHW